MNRHKRSWLAASMAAAVSALLIGASARAPFDPLRSVPAGALAVLSAANPFALAVNAVRFMRAAGFEEEAFQAEAALAPFLGSGDAPAPDEAVARLAAIVDPKRRVVTAVYPGAEDPEDVSVLLMVPIKGGPDVEAAIAEALDGLSPGGGEISVSLDFPGYLIAGAMGFDAATVGQADAIDLSRLANLPAASLAVWVDVSVGSAYLDLAKQGLGSLIPGVGRSFDDEEEALDFGLGNEPEADDEAVGNDEAAIEEEATVEDDGGDGDDAGAEDAAIGNEGAGTGGVGNDAAGDDESTADSDAEATEDDGASIGNDGMIGNDDASDGEGGIVGNDASSDDVDGDEYAEDFDWDDGDDAPLGPELGKLVEWLLEFADEFKSVEAVLTVQPDRAWLRMGARVAEGGKLAAYAARASSGDPTLPYLSFCEADSLMSFAWSSPADWAMPLLKELYALILPDAEVFAEAMEGYAAYAAATGPNGAMSIGLGVSEEISRLAKSGGNPSDGEVVGILARGLDLQVSGAVQLTDRQAFRDASASMLDIAKAPGYADLIKASGIGFEVDRKVGLVKGMPYDAFAYRFTSGEGSGPEAAVTELLGRIMSPVYVYKDDKAYMGFGKPERVLGTIERGGAVAPLKADKTFKALRAGAPTDVRALYYISTKSLWRLVMRFLPDGTPPLDFNVNDLSGILSWFDASPGSMGFGFGVGAEDIRSIAVLADM